MINFLRVEQSVKELKSQIIAGEIDQLTFEDHLLGMIDYAADGCYWMFGHKTDNWYRHNGEQWVPDDPGKLRYLMPSSGSKQHPQNPPISSSLPDLKAGWKAINWGWFVASLIVLGLIAAIIYNSSL